MNTGYRYAGNYRIGQMQESVYRLKYNNKSGKRRVRPEEADDEGESQAGRKRPREKQGRETEKKQKQEMAVKSTGRMCEVVSNNGY